MKKILFIIAATMIAGTSFTGCKNNATQTTSEPQTDSTAVAQETNYLTAIDSYLVNEIGSQYAAGEHCVPYYGIVGTDEGDTTDIMVWGDFWVMNYNMAGDTLKTVSGGNHPGLMHLRKTSTGYEVTAFDQVTDGAGNQESAQQIFAEKYDSLQAIQSDEQRREELRKKFLADYVKAHNLNATLYQDYGWPAKQIAQ